MNWVSFITGGMTVIFAIALFTSGPEGDLDISKNTLSNWIAGNTYPTIDKAFQLADLLEVSVEELYERIKSPMD